MVDPLTRRAYAATEGDSPKRKSTPISVVRRALDVVALSPVDAAIVDLMLPDGDGIELCRRLREWSEMPIIVLSAVHEEEKKIQSLSVGADDYITKPFSPRELVARLGAVLRRASPEPEESVIAADGLEVDLVAHVVRRDGEEIHLTRTEFELLRVLVRNRGRLLTHRALLSEVWGARTRVHSDRRCGPSRASVDVDPRPAGIRRSVYAYLSQAQNNGSAFAGYSGFVQPVAGNAGAHGITFADLAGGCVMTLGRFVPILAAVALAGSLGPRRFAPPGLGTLRTDTPTFVIFVIGFVAIFAVLTFLTVLMLGPLAQALSSQMLG